MDLRVKKKVNPKSGQESYYIKVYDESGNEVSTPPSTARPFTKREFETFVENGGEQALCIACETREKIQNDISKIESDNNLSLSQKRTAIKAKQDQLLRSDANWKSQLDDMVGQDQWSDGQISKALDEIQPLEATNIKPSSKFGKEGTDPTGDSDGDGIPDLEDADPYQTPEQVKSDGAKAAAIKGLNGHHQTMPQSEYEELKKNKFYIPETVKNENKYIPEFIKRDDDVVYSGKNNTWIVLGRDRTGRYEGGAKNESDKILSGYGHHMAAGAIDIVVGRMAPFPVSDFDSGSSSVLEDIPILGPLLPKDRYAVGPLFVAKEDPEKPHLKFKLGQAPKDPNNDNRDAHPGVQMDAARIYMSQKTDADSNFGIMDTDELDVLSAADKVIGIDDFRKDLTIGNKKPLGKLKPRSAIINKADELRYIARHDIKLVTGGAGPPGSLDRQYNSQGGKVQSVQGIQLLAGNGYDSFGKINPPQPLVLGNNFKNAQLQLLDLFHDLAAILEALLMTQMEFNGFVMTHFHLSPLFGFPTTFSPILPAIGIKTMIDHLVRSYLGIIFLRMNLNTYRINYYEPSATGYVLSRYNTAN